MLIIRKKHLIKTAVLLLGLILIIIGMYIKNKDIQKQNEKEALQKKYAILTSACSLVNEINLSIKEAEDTGDHTQNFIDIYASSKSVKNIFDLLNEDIPNVQSWFASLCNYAKEQTPDKEKNEYYFQKTKEIEKIIVDNISKNNVQDVITELEALLKKDASNTDYKQILYDMEKQYSLLKKQIKAERKEISDYAKNILGLPFSPSQFKGNHIFPKAISYSADQSYANIFPEGKTLLNMSTSVGNKTDTETVNENDLINSIMYEYAPYAEQYDIIHKVVSENIVYYIVCPIHEIDSTRIINYDESFKIAIEKSTNNILAFDATKYLKNHPSIKIDNVTLLKTKLEANEKIIIHDQKYYVESSNSVNQEEYYTLFDGNTKTTHKKKKYLTFLGIT